MAVARRRGGGRHVADRGADAMPPDAPAAGTERAASSGSAGRSGRRLRRRRSPRPRARPRRAHRRSRARPARSRVNGDEASRRGRVHVRRRPEPRDHARGDRRAREVRHPGDVLHRDAAARSASTARESRELLARELADGFMVGSHSVTHPNLKHAAARRRSTKEIDNVDQDARRRRPSRPIGLFRPPYGALVGRGPRAAQEARRSPRCIWSVDTLDWQAQERRPAAQEGRCR